MADPEMHALRFNKLLLDLRKLTGRDLVIVGASVLDAALREALLRTLKPLSSKDREDIFDSESGAARRLSAKPDLGSPAPVGPSVRAPHPSCRRSARRRPTFLPTIA